jgi:DHA2 family methylenomycin A resistance protein-like MFS transporter
MRGMQMATAISACLLLTALVLACLVHPEPHAEEPDDTRKSSLRAVRGTERG